MTSPNSSYSQVTAVTRKYFIPVMTDNIFYANPLLERAKSKGWLKKINGGSEIVQPLEYATNAGADWYAGSDTLSTTDTETFSACKVDWKQLYCPITVTRIDELKNSGEAQVVDFVKAKVKNAERTMAYKLSTGLYSAGTDSDSIIGLRVWVNADETVGGISQSTSSWWQGQENTTTTTMSLSALQTMYSNCSEGADQPTVIVGTKAQYNRLWSLLTPQQRFQDASTAKAGFSSLMFNGTPWLVDTNVPTNYLFFLNEQYLKLCVHKDENMRMTDFERPLNQNVLSAMIFWAGALLSSNNRFHGDFTSLAA